MSLSHTHTQTVCTHKYRHALVCEISFSAKSKWSAFIVKNSLKQKGQNKSSFKGWMFSNTYKYKIWRKKTLLGMETLFYSIWALKRLYITCFVHTSRFFYTQALSIIHTQMNALESNSAQGYFRSGAVRDWITNLLISKWSGWPPELQSPQIDKDKKK